MEAIYQTLVGAAVGLVGSVLGSYYAHRLQKGLDVNNLKSAFYGEVKALLTIVEMREYISNLERLIVYVKNTGDTKILAFNATRIYFQVYEQNVGKIGLLPAPLPEKLGLFYSLGNALLEDMDALEKKIKEDTLTPEQLLNMMEEQLMVLRAGANTGYEVLDQINPDIHHTPSSLLLSVSVKSAEIEPVR